MEGMGGCMGRYMTIEWVLTRIQKKVLLHLKGEGTEADNF
jgi:hypothetical protein